MKTKNSLIKTIVMVFALVVLGACSNDDDGEPIVAVDPTIVDLALDNSDLSILVEALTAANLVTTLQGDGPFTVFAPTNAAFQQFLTDNNFASLGDIPNDVLTDVLLNHVIAGENLSTGLSTGYVSSLSTAGVDGRNLSLFIDTASGVSINGVASVTSADNQGSNGVVHIVDGVIGLPNIVDHAVANGDLTSLVGALTDGGNTTFTDLLSDAGTNFTVFAPVNSAFDAFTNPNSNDLANILSNHVIVGAAAASTSLTNSYLTTAAENADGDALSIYINTDNGVTFNGVSNVAAADIVATNGIIHAVDAVIDLPDVTTFATADPTFETLVAALTAYPNFEYVAALQTPNGTAPAPFTVFAPTNDAFGDLLTDLGASGLGDIDETTLASVLELHVIAGLNVRAEDLPGLDGNSVATLGGQNIVIDANAPAISGPDGIANPIVATNVQAMNGVIHAISRVIR